MPDTKANTQAPAWIVEFRKRFIVGHGSISNGDNYPQEADAWVEADIEELEDFIWKVEAESYQRGRADREAELQGTNPY